jgi:ADP-ribose pyrophosphatase YjhB (NUDIX family)
VAFADIRGAGVVAWKQPKDASEKVKVLLVHRTKRPKKRKKRKDKKQRDRAKVDWSLPKGKLTKKKDVA